MMFDRIVLTPAPQRIYNDSTVKVIEKRAPTDESVQLLREMETAAECKVIKSIKVGDTAFECVVHMAQDAMSQDTLCRAVFSLNGKQLSADSRTSDYNTTPEKRMRELVEAVAERIAVEIVTPALLRLGGAAWR